MPDVGLTVPGTAEKLPWEEITRRYPDQYVVLADYDWPNMSKVTAGVVVATSPDRKAAHGLRRDIDQVAVLWTGTLRRPKGPLLFSTAPNVDR